VCPTDRAHRGAHRDVADWPSALRDPGRYPVRQPIVGVSLGVSAQPGQIHYARVVAAARLQLDVASLSFAPQHSAHRRASDTEHRSSRLIGLRESCPIRRHSPPAKIQRSSHRYVGSRLPDRVKLRAV
jgi:hypothetical protein